MTGRIIGISGPTVTVDLGGLSLYERVAVGTAELLGEVIRLERGRAVIQVYEDTRGLGIGEPAAGLNSPLNVELGPGLLNRIFDGLQSPLEDREGAVSSFLEPGLHREALVTDRQWEFRPVLEQGDKVEPGTILGCVDEGSIEHPLLVHHASGTLGRIAEGGWTLGEPLAYLEDDTPIHGSVRWPVRQARPYRRKKPPTTPLITGQRCIDFLYPIAEGGTAIIPGGFGTGKTILEQTIAKFASADIVVYVGCGERGNEMAEMIDEFRGLKDPWSGHALMARTAAVVNTSNMPVVAREASIYTAVTMAEYYRDLGLRVLLLADSLSRWAEALREISSALEEMPGEEGYPTYLASRLATFMSRAGLVETHSGRTGSLTMILSVSPPGGDFTEPVTQACLRTSGTFLMLDTTLAQSRHYPAVSWSQSYSLYADVEEHFVRETDKSWRDLKQECRNLLQKESELKEVAEIVGPEGLQDEDRLLMEVAGRIRNEFLAQNAFTDDAFSPPDRTIEKLKEILKEFRRRKKQQEEDQALKEKES